MMSTMKTLRIRNVPDDVYRTLEMRAGVAGMSLSAYLLRELQGSAERLTIEELIAEIRQADPVEPSEESWAAVRAERDAAP
jgi:plasmid stability protein